MLGVILMGKSIKLKDNCYLDSSSISNRGNGFDFNGTNNKMKFVVDAELIDAKEKGIMKSFDFDDFGKTVFLTKEEAEQALKGGEG